MTNNEKNPGILDKIMTSKQVSDISNFNPMETVSSVLKFVSGKEEDILRRRYGLNGEKEETLEEIGSHYNVTRERIRQIEKSAIQRIKEASGFDHLIREVETIITNLIHQHGGIIEKEYFYEKLLSYAGNNKINRNAVNFLMSSLLDLKYRDYSDREIRESWQLKSHNPSLLRKSIDIFLKILNQEGKPLSEDELIKRFKESDLYNSEKEVLNDEVIKSYLRVSAKISMNPFGDFGLVNWGSITPKRINDKIYTVMKKAGRPLHFKKITELINKAGFDRKKAYPPTVHNELILNGQYVLVGRGIYALKEWGYKSGVVADVIEDIIRSSEKPLSRDEIIKKVLERRMVKKNTVLLALSNKKRFQKNPDNTYSLIKQQE